jgi:hypothetical protein
VGYVDSGWPLWNITEWTSLPDTDIEVKDGETVIGKKFEASGQVPAAVAHFVTAQSPIWLRWNCIPDADDATPNERKSTQK